MIGVEIIREIPKWAKLLIVTGVTIVAVIVVLAVVPVTTSFQFGISSTYGSKGLASKTYPAGAYVHFTWYSNNATTTEFSVSGPGGNTIYQSEGRGGAYSFNAQGGSYQFSVDVLSSGSNAVTISGQYSAPLI